MNTIYSDLIKAYPTTAALFEYLKSPAGGSLIIRDEMSNPAQPFAIIHYDKNKSDMSVPHVEYFRSVVWNVMSNHPVCAAPSRGRRFSDAIDTIGNALPADQYVVEDFTDGVMINMFFDGLLWRAATRTQLDASGSFYGNTPFGTLFWEAFRNCGIPLASIPTNISFSWVLQHPDERVVIPIPYNIPRIVLVEASYFDVDGHHRVITDLHNNPLFPTLNRYAVKNVAVGSLEEVKDLVAAWGKQYGHLWQGVVIKQICSGGASRRWKLRADEYNAARHLRGNQAKREYLWLERWAEGRLPEYLRIFPEEAFAANEIVENFKNCTQEAHNVYVQVYRNRAYPIGAAPQKYRKIVWEAHQAKQGAYFGNFRAFMNQQDTARKLWFVNYEKRYAAS
jgi:hypothetical protein